MNNINVIVELCAEDRARLDNILEALKGTAGHTCSCASAAATVKPSPQEPAKKEQPTPAAAEPVKEAAAEPVKTAEPEPEKAETVPEVTASELQSKVVQLVNAGKKDAARAIVTEYAKSVGEIPAEKRAEVLKRLNALEG